MTKQSELKRYLDAGKRDGVIPAVERHLLMRPAEGRPTDVLHPSEITSADWCLRASYLLLNGAKKRHSPPGQRLQSIFDEGHEIHTKWQRWFMEMGVLYGVWEDTEGNREWGRITSGARYLEVPLSDPGLIVSGHADGWLIMGEAEEYLLEIKSIGTGTIRVYQPSLLSESLSKSFSNITRPFVGHIRQASFYRYLMGLMYEAGTLPRRPPDWLLFIYECKENQQAKEFKVRYDEEVIAPIVERIHLLIGYLASGDEPPCDFPQSCKKCGELDA